jgi:hypothetical protein
VSHLPGLDLLGAQQARDVGDVAGMEFVLPKRVGRPFR